MSQTKNSQYDNFFSKPGAGRRWLINLLVFGVLISLVIGYFFWQSSQTRKGFLKRAEGRSQMLAKIISFSLDNALSSQQAIESTIHDFLVSSAEFTDYLDSIEPFSSDELTSFANETRLVGITIIHSGDNNEYIAGPPQWADYAQCEAVGTPLRYEAPQKRYILSWPRTYEPGCIILGFDSTRTEKLLARIGVKKLMANMATLPMIEYIRLEIPPAVSATLPLATFIGGDKNVVETRVAFGQNRILVVGINANRYVIRLRQLKAELFIFSAVFLFLGIFFSWVLHRYQNAYLEKVKDFERHMARQREDAALGRATATISHEVKNPLNAISIGLQRLEIEVETSLEYTKLISAMRQSVNRTSAIISTLKQHSQPIIPQYQKNSPQQMIESAITLYSSQCRDSHIFTHYDAGPWHGNDIDVAPKIHVDKRLFGQVIENLLKNAVEAQPGGGIIEIYSPWNGVNEFVLIMENLGFDDTGIEVKRLFEPYYSSKTTGTGLGLSISRRIIEAHGGTIEAGSPEPGKLRITLRIPIMPSGESSTWV